MFRVQTKRTHLTAALDLSELIYHSTVRAVLRGSSNAVFALIMNIVLSSVFIVALYITMKLMGWQSGALRGDFVLFLMAGVMSYMTYNKTMKAVFGAEGPTSPMMLHSPMTPAISISAAALSALYQQILTVCVVLFVYHVAFKPVEIYQPVLAFTMLLASWFFGVGTGMVLLSIKPWAPKLAPLLLMIVSRINIFASGKMMLGNTLSFTLLKFFDWNPLFHLIDQMRGALFINYMPRNSSISYALWVSTALVAIGLMGEFFSRRNAPKY
jgi:ABC-type polysaccharide/polyol phosphate export permease